LAFRIIKHLILVCVFSRKHLAPVVVAFAYFHLLFPTTFTNNGRNSFAKKSENIIESNQKSAFIKPVNDAICYIFSKLINPY
jgi:hypothetical protein